jgi:hypothetical protein
MQFADRVLLIALVICMEDYLRGGAFRLRLICNVEEGTTDMQTGLALKGENSQVGASS